MGHYFDVLFPMGLCVPYVGTESDIPVSTNGPPDPAVRESFRGHVDYG